MKPAERDLDTLRADIEERLDQGGPFAHNLIGLALQQIDQRYGRAEMNRAIVDLGLTSYGWSVRPSLAAGEAG